MSSNLTDELSLRCTRTTLDESLLWTGTARQAAEWMAYVGLRGAYAAERWQPNWLRYNGRDWQPVSRADVIRRVNCVLRDVYDRRIQQTTDPAEVMQLLRLVDMNWVLRLLMDRLRAVVTVPLGSAYCANRSS